MTGRLELARNGGHCCSLVGEDLPQDLSWEGAEEAVESEGDKGNAGVSCSDRYHWEKRHANYLLGIWGYSDGEERSLQMLSRRKRAVFHGTKEGFHAKTQ